jgi:hypothetical protein
MLVKFLAKLFILLALTHFLQQEVSAAKSKVLTVRYPNWAGPADPRTEYDRAVVDLVLQKTVDKYGPYQLISSLRLPQSRAFASLKSNELVDVIATTSSIDRERDFLPIRHDIHRGLMGVKIMLVQKDKLSTFAKIDRLDQLKDYTAGLGHDWPDADVFRAEGFRVMASPTYEGLFKMLATARFDFFPRSLPEIWDEAKTHAVDNLVVEPSFAVIYNLPAYIFVNKKNTALAKRLDEGFRIAIKDGSFHKLFMERHGENIAKAQLKNRKLFYINNPTLPLEYKNIRPDLSFAL